MFICFFMNGEGCLEVKRRGLKSRLWFIRYPSITLSTTLVPVQKYTGSMTPHIPSLSKLCQSSSKGTKTHQRNIWNFILLNSFSAVLHLTMWILWNFWNYMFHKTLTLSIRYCCPCVSSYCMHTTHVESEKLNPNMKTNSHMKHLKLLKTATKLVSELNLCTNLNMSTDPALWRNEMTPDFHMHECCYSCLKNIKTKTKNANSSTSKPTQSTSY